MNENYWKEQLKQKFDSVKEGKSTEHNYALSERIEEAKKERETIKQNLKAVLSGSTPNRYNVMDAYRQAYQGENDSEILQRMNTRAIETLDEIAQLRAKTIEPIGIVDTVKQIMHRAYQSMIPMKHAYVQSG